MNLAPGAIFGPYHLVEFIGEGGFGEVWQATDTRSGETVALKVFSGRFGSEGKERLRAELEVLAANAIGEQQHVVRVLAGGSEPAPHVVMEYVAGSSLATELAEQGHLSQARTLEIGQAVAEALSAAASAGIVHRDVKASNILLGSDGAIKLSDFGIAHIVGYQRASVTSQILLSAPYAAPEVWDGQATAASDLYATGVVLYECLTGAPPFTGTYTQVSRGHLDKPPDLDRLPADTLPGLQALIGSCLAKEPADRPADARALADRLSALRAELRQQASSRLPEAIGPWRLEGPHPTQAWAWRVRNSETGQRATLEVLFSATAALGETLARAVTANPDLVPLGAEGLAGSNRLLLQPGENLGKPMPAPLAFWVAREELPLPPPAPLLDGPALSRLVAGLQRLTAAASTAGVTIDLNAGFLLILPDGSFQVTRPGLPALPGTAPSAGPLAVLRPLVLPALLPLLDQSSSLAQLASGLNAGERTTLIVPEPTRVVGGGGGAGAQSRGTTFGAAQSGRQRNDSDAIVRQAAQPRKQVSGPIPGGQRQGRPDLKGPEDPSVARSPLDGASIGRLISVATGAFCLAAVGVWQVFSFQGISEDNIPFLLIADALARVAMIMCMAWAANGWTSRERLSRGLASLARSQQRRLF